MKVYMLILSSVLFLSLLSANEIEADQKSSLFQSDDDGAFDVSKFLSQQYGFMPVPIMITEPAVGYGGGLSIMFLHDTFESAKERKSPPSISGILAAATENETKFGGGFHLGFWQEDTIRTTTFLGAMDVNMDFYLKNFPIAMNLEGHFAYQELLVRINDSDFFLGGNYIYSNVQSKRNDEGRPLLDSIFENDFHVGAAAAVMLYDTRNSIFTPSEGLYTKVSLRRFAKNLGGDDDFWRVGFKTLYFTPLSKKFLLGVRVEGETVESSETIPFFLNPSISMRGIPAMRYQGEKKLLSEFELRWEFMNRWNLLLFGGGGKVFGNIQHLQNNSTPTTKKESFFDATFHSAGGVGFRYELARKYDLWGGLDFATSSDEDIALYITVGSAWSGL